MNNIKSFNEFTGIELEQIVYEKEVNEGIMGTGIRGHLNKRAAKKVRAELAEEIEMSKSVMEGIKQGLETLSDNFETIQKSLDASDENDKKKGEKQKLLDDITNILENSKKSTWDLNELIDEGEIDYTGFTANIGIASVAYFGILLTPFRAGVMIHKGYNYFFNIVKNTIRKALVMLQLNFDQFSNLIVTQSMKATGLVTAIDAAKEVDEFYGNLLGQIGSSKELTKKQIATFEKAMKGAKDKFEQQRKSIKDQSTAENLFNNLDPYNNTYTKSLEALRQYSGDDVQKHLDAIKTSMSKLAGQEVDLQTYSELIIAAAEEHAYKVSSSIYNKFAKMTEVFSLPNQQKLIDLILAANKEQKVEAKKIRDEKKKSKELQEKIESKSKDTEDGLKVFKSLDGVEIEELEGGEVLEDGETVKKYDESKIKADKWTYDEFNKLDKNDQDSLEIWFELHPEVLKKCDETLQVYITSNPKSIYFDSSYIDSLIDYIYPCLTSLEEVKEFYILNFDEYINESNKKKKKKKKKKVTNSSTTSGPELALDDNVKEDLDKQFDTVKKTFEDLLKLIFGEDIEDFNNVEVTDEMKAKLDYIMAKCDEDGDKKVLGELKTFRDNIDKKQKYNINFDSLDDNQINDVKELYENKEVAIAALKAIGKKVLKDNTFVKNSKIIVDCINKCVDKGKSGLSLMTYILLANSIKDLKEKRNMDYSTVEESSENTDIKKSEN